MARPTYAQVRGPYLGRRTAWPHGQRTGHGKRADGDGERLGGVDKHRQSKTFEFRAPYGFAAEDDGEAEESVEFYCLISGFAIVGRFTGLERP